MADEIAPNKAPRLSTAPGKDNLKESPVEHFRRLTQHLESQNLPINPHLGLGDYDRYKSELKEYSVKPKEAIANAEKFGTTSKFDFQGRGSRDGYWKIHLNVQPSSVKKVSKYLIENGYLHKYLSGGDIEDGKIFTVYPGAYRLTAESASSISKDLLTHLSQPVDHTEIELTPGVIGRFHGPNNKQASFHQYGSCGYSWTNEHAMQMLTLRYWSEGEPNLDARKKKLKNTAELTAYNKLREIFGDYFFIEK